jgi:hypothetical protein
MSSLAIEVKEADEVIRVLKEAVRPDGPFLGNHPSKVQSDNGKEYANKVFQDHCIQNDVEYVQGLPYSPWVNGQG